MSPLKEVPDTPKGRVDNNPTPEQLRKLYWDDGLSAWLIGEELGISETHVLRLMKKANIPRRKQRKKHVEIN